VVGCMVCISCMVCIKKSVPISRALANHWLGGCEMGEVIWGGKGARTKASKKRKRTQLLETAARMFTNAGYERTSLTDIANELGITKPALYYYVDSKEDILFSISKASLEKLKRALVATQEGPANARNKLLAFLKKYIKLMQSDFGKCLVTSNKMALSDESRKVLRADRKMIDLAVRQIISDGIAEGSLESTSPKLTTFAIFGAINWMCFWHREGNETNDEQVAEQLLEFILQGIEPRP